VSVNEVNASFGETYVAISRAVSFRHPVSGRSQSLTAPGVPSTMRRGPWGIVASSWGEGEEWTPSFAREASSWALKRPPTWARGRRRGEAEAEGGREEGEERGEEEEEGEGEAAVLPEARLSHTPTRSDTLGWGGEMPTAESGDSGSCPSAVSPTNRGTSSTHG
jgi:hypothetical protein